jgi:hypothetical protein
MWRSRSAKRGSERADHCSFAYSALACWRIGISGSAFFHRAKKSWYAVRALAVVVCQHIGAAKTKMRESPDRQVRDKAAVVDDLLKFRNSRVILSCLTVFKGQRLGRYEILSAIRAGGMGEVYRANPTLAHDSSSPERGMVNGEVTFHMD